MHDTEEKQVLEANTGEPQIFADVAQQSREQRGVSGLPERAPLSKRRQGWGAPRFRMPKIRMPKIRMHKMITSAIKKVKTNDLVKKAVDGARQAMKHKVVQNAVNGARTAMKHNLVKDAVKNAKKAVGATKLWDHVKKLPVLRAAVAHAKQISGHILNKAKEGGGAILKKLKENDDIRGAIKTVKATGGHFLKHIMKNEHIKNAMEKVKKSGILDKLKEHARHIGDKIKTVRGAAEDKVKNAMDNAKESGIIDKVSDHVGDAIKTVSGAAAPRLSSAKSKTQTLKLDDVKKDTGSCVVSADYGGVFTIKIATGKGRKSEVSISKR